MKEQQTKRSVRVLVKKNTSSHYAKNEKELDGHWLRSECLLIGRDGRRQKKLRTHDNVIEDNVLVSLAYIRTNNLIV